MSDQRSGITRQNLGWRGLRRDISRTSLFLISNLARLITPTFALPTATSTSTTSSTATAPSTTSSANGNRDGSFHILAYGTQDIVALVGIFAIDSVERYAVGYSRGFVATAVSTLSLLGLLRCVRLLVKLGLGADRFRKAGLDLKASRPMFGIQDEDYVPADAVHEVYHVQRKREDGIDSRYLYVSSIDKIDKQYSLAKRQGKWYPWVLLILSILFDGRHFLILLLLSTLCVWVTCFFIVPNAGAFEHQS